MLALVLSGALDGYAQSSSTKKKKRKPKTVPCQTGCAPATTAPTITADTPEGEAAQKELADLARGLRNAAPGAYDKLAAFSAKNAGNVVGARAALALGYDDYTKNRAQQALAWFAKAQGDTLLREYVLFWSAQAKHALRRDGEAYADFETIQKEFPDSANKEQLLEAFSPVATATGHAEAAVEALNDYPATASKPALLLERAHAEQAARKLASAAKDYQTLYYKFPLTDEAKAAGTALPGITHELGSEYPWPGVELQQHRAQAFFDAKKWREARPEWEKLLGMLKDPANPKRQLAQLRVAQCRVQLKSSMTLIASLAPTDPEVDAERLFALSQYQRSAKKDTEMLGTIEQLAQKYPQSKWNEEGLFQGGNYYWVLLDRTRAASYYQRLLEAFPAGKNTFNAEWRVAWVAYLERQPYADDKITVFLRKYPVSANASNALYWLGRDAERSGNPGHARAFYRTAAERFPQTFFGLAAAVRLKKMGAGDEDAPDFLAQIPPAPELKPFDEQIPEKAKDRWERAQALRTIAFDASAEQELKAAYFATTSPRFMLEAAQAAFDQGHFAAGMAYARIAVPSFDSRKFSDIPLPAWKALYPLPYETPIRRESAKNGLDPMVVSGLIRQESTFQADVISYANAYGLMQLLPKTAKIVAKKEHVRYVKAQLFNPDYNIQLGTSYFKGLIDLTGAQEYALAAYNAGEDRIAAWKAERNYDEIPELVESIPFSQTRDYVQIVLRNAELYRMIYGSSAATASNGSGAAANRRR